MENRLVQTLAVHCFFSWLGSSVLFWIDRGRVWQHFPAPLLGITRELLPSRTKLLETSKSEILHVITEVCPCVLEENRRLFETGRVHKPAC